MKDEIKKSKGKKAFTIVELLTVMSIIMILLAILLPALNRVRRYANDLKQRAQFHSIDVGLELYKNEFEGYPDSGANGTDDLPYCGAMKLAEAMVGRDLLGYHPSSNFRQDGQDGNGNYLYYPKFNDGGSDQVRAANLKARKGPYMDTENAYAYNIKALFGPGVNIFGTDPNYVLCDEYARVRTLDTGKKVGMPILYYKADISKTKHDETKIVANATTSSENIYNSFDNQELIDLSLPWDTTLYHPMASGSKPTPDGYNSDPTIFYRKTRDTSIPTPPRPMRPDSYILISAGYDGLYGTDDDVFNFGK